MRKLLLLFCLFITIQANSQTFNLVWSDEFNGTGAPNPTNWGNELGYIRNNELQYYTNSTNNARQNNGNLEITVIKEPMNGYQYTSASIITLRKIDFLYGKIEGRFKLPMGQGLWSCFWTLGANYEQVWWPQCGEFDIFEHLNNETTIYTTAHWADATNAHTSLGNSTYGIDVTQYHNYAIIWTPTAVKWTIDDVQVHEINITDGINSTQEFHKPHYILVNLPIGGDWPGAPDASTVLPATMFCDYIRFYEYVPAGSQTGNQRINCGGDISGTFSSDKWYSNGATWSYTTAVNVTGVANAAPADVYQSNRAGNLTYTISGLTPNAPYTSRLHFAETNFNRSGQRVFNVKINGTQLLTNFDIYVAAGAANKAVVQDFPATSDATGKIAIQLVSVTSNAQINGIEVFDNLTVSVSGITLSSSTASFSSVGEFTTLTATVSPTNATNKILTWSSSNLAVATVSRSGVVTAVGNGTATITASATDGSNVSATCAVTVTLSTSELILNGDFSQGTTNWVLNLIAPAVATANVVNGVYEVNVTTPSTTTWYVYPQQAPFTMTQGVNYKLSFDVWADNANVMDYYLGKNYGDMGNYFNQYGLSVTSTKQTFTYNLTMTLPTDNNCRLVFAVAKFTGKVYLDNVHLTKVVPTINLSLNQPTTASTQASTTYTPAKAVDGNASTQWRCSTSDPNPWIYVDLGSNCSFDRVKLDWSTYYAKAYLIQSSTDAVNWTTVSTLTAQNGGTDDNINLTGQGRYVRIYVTTKSNTRGVYLINFEVYGNTSLKSAHITGQSPLSTVNVKNVDVKVFPNPVLNNLTIENAGNIEKIEICSLTGQVIIKSIHSGNKANVDLSGLSSGLYVLKVYQQNKVANTFKIIKK